MPDSLKTKSNYVMEKMKLFCLAFQQKFFIKKNKNKLFIFEVPRNLKKIYNIISF
jgi:hypothetical protein